MATLTLDIRSEKKHIKQALVSWRRARSEYESAREWHHNNWGNWEAQCARDRKLEKLSAVQKTLELYERLGLVKKDTETGWGWLRA